jgi:signal transduction histidine kinase
VSGTVDLRRPEEIARLRHSLRTALNSLIGFSDVVRRQAEEQGSRAEAGLMAQVARAGREAMEIVLHLLPVKSHVSDSALPMLRTNLATRVERMKTALAAFETKTRGACAAETRKMRLALQDLAEFTSGVDPVPPAPEPAPHSNIFEMPPAESGRPLPQGGNQTLVVAGDEESGAALGRLLESAGVTPVAESAGAAIERLQHEAFDLVLLDVSLLGLLQAMRANSQFVAIPVVVLASPEQGEAAARALESGADDVIAKPVDPLLARARIGAVLFRRRAGHGEPLVGAIARDLHELLDAMVANTSLVLGALPANDPNCEVLAGVAGAGERAVELTRRLAAFGTQGAGAMQPVNLSDVVQEIAEWLRASLPAAVRLPMHFTPGLPAITGDPRQIQQLVFNLVANAGEAIGGREGTVTVETGLRYLPDGAPAQPPFGKIPSGYYIYIGVHDTGPGIAGEVRPHIFDASFSTRAAGRGQGLATAMEIARAHGGVIHVQTEPGKGSRFELLLPAPHP